MAPTKCWVTLNTLTRRKVWKEFRQKETLLMKFGGSNVWVRKKSGIHLICGPECYVAIMRRWGTVMDGFIKNTLSFLHRKMWSPSIIAS